MSDSEAVLLVAHVEPIEIDDPILENLDSWAADSPSPYAVRDVADLPIPYVVRDMEAGGPGGDVVVGHPGGDVVVGRPGGDVAVGGPAGGPPAPDEEGPYDVRVIKPRALNLLYLYEQAGLSVPPEITGALGARVPVLLYHGMTPFRRPGNRGTRIWGMGYESRLTAVQGDTVSYSPDWRVRDVATLDQEFRVGIKAGGELEVPSEALQVLDLIPGVSLDGVQLRVAADARFGLAIQFRFSLLEVQVGPFDAGGVKWNLYSNPERLDRFQPLVQTLLLPEVVSDLELEVEVWIKSKGWPPFGIGARQWNYDPKTFKVGLEGLNPKP